LHLYLRRESADYAYNASLENMLHMIKEVSIL